MPVSSTALVKALEQLGLLSPEKLQVATALAASVLQGDQLADALVAREWLTAYQANEVLHGRGEALVVGPYRLLECLGRGGMGQVFKARHTVLDRLLALKLILPERLGSQQAVERFLREARAAAMLSHPNIVTIHDAGQAGGNFYLAMELLPGSNLADYLEHRGPLPVAEACGYVRQAALGLQHAHEKGLVHRDIKPANLLRTDDGQIKVLDMGLALVLAATTLTREVGTRMGTLDYMAPEQVSDAHLVDIRADIYSLGCTLYHLLARRVPFDDCHPAARVLVRQQQCPRPVEEYRPDVPATLARVLRRMLARQPAGRYQAPAAVAEALQPFCAQEPPPVPDRPVESSRSTDPQTDESAVAPSLSPSTEAPTPQKEPDETTGSSGGSLRLPRRLLGALGLGIVLSAAIISVVVLLPWPGKNKPPKRATPPPEIDNSIGLKLVLIPKGTFTMGSPENEEGRDATEEQHKVEITKEFYLGIYEVTQGQFRSIMNYNPSYFSKDGKGKEGVDFAQMKPAGGKDKVKGHDTDAFPVENVSWCEAVEFCKKLSTLAEEKAADRRYRLPTEAEWEYACRGGAPSYQVFHFGSSLSPRQVNFNRHLDRTCKVGSYKPNGFGLYDMHGNVWEWCSDWYGSDYYGESPRRDPQGPDKGSLRVFRGGSWASFDRNCRSALHHGSPPRSRWNYRGFRVALVPPGR
jgi:formylglycine-generating enzyme required for sulfatase activity